MEPRVGWCRTAACSVEAVFDRVRSGGEGSRAERLGCTQPAISQAEAGGASLSISTIQRFAAALGCDLQLAIVSRDVALSQGVPGTLHRRHS